MSYIRGQFARILAVALFTAVLAVGGCTEEEILIRGATAYQP